MSTRHELYRLPGRPGLFCRTCGVRWPCREASQAATDRGRAIVQPSGPDAPLAPQASPQARPGETSVKR